MPFREVRSLTGLRAVAVLMVLVCHLNRSTGRTAGLGFGVELFFVLSGYLITGQLLTEWRRRDAVDLVGFYVRRAFRLLPAAWLCILLVGAVACVSARVGLQGWDTVAAALYIGNWAEVAGGAYRLGWLEHTWSLCVEAQFYVVWPPVLLWLLRRRGPRTVLATAVVGALAVTLTRTTLYAELSPLHLARGSDMVADQLLWGCSLALAYHAVGRGVLARAGNACGLLGVGLVLVAALGIGTVQPYRFGLPLVAAGAVLVIASCLNDRGVVHGLLGLPVVVLMGEWSYSIYLWHYPIVQALVSTGSSRTHTAAAAVPLTVIVAAASYYGVERPLRRRGRALARRATAELSAG